MARLVNRKNAAELVKSVPGQRRAEVLDHILDNDSTSIRSWGRVAVVTASGIPIAAIALVAYVLAGKSTTLNVSVTLALSLAFTGVAGVLGLLLRNRRKKIAELTDANGDLKHGLHERQARLRQNNLPDAVTPRPKP